MSLEEKYEALMKSYQLVSTLNQDLVRRLNETEGQNLFLRKQLDKSMKQKQQDLEGPTSYNLEELSEAESQHSIIERTNQGGQFELRDLLSMLTLMTLELIFLNSKANSILRGFLIG